MERIWMIIFIFVACGLFAIRLSEFSNLMRELQKKHNLFQTEVDIINDYMRTKNINIYLRERIHEYLKYI